MAAVRKEFEALMNLDLSTESKKKESVAKFQQKQERFKQIVEAHPQFAKETWGHRYRYPLFLAAACSSSLLVVKAVFDAYPEAAKMKTANDWTPLHYACRFNQSDQVHKVVQLLLGAYPEAAKMTNTDGWTPLHMACGCNQSDQVTKVVQWLLEAYPEAAKMKLTTGSTPLSLACRFNQSDQVHKVVQLLLEAYPEAAKLKTTNGGDTPLSLACYCNRSDPRVFLRLLETYPEAVKLKGNAGKTPMDIARQKSASAEIIEMLANPERVVREANTSRRKKLFYDHFDTVQALAQQPGIVDSSRIVTVFETSLDDMTDFLQLKYYFTAVNAQYRLDTIEEEDRKRLIYPSLEKAKDWCVSPFHVAMYRVALRYALDKEIITHFQFDQLDVAALECDIANSDFILEMQTMIRQNSVRIDRMEGSLDTLGQAVARSIQNLQENLMAVQETVKMLHQDVNSMATAINDTQVAVNDFKAALARKRKIEAGCCLVSSILNAVSLGAAGSALQGVVGFTLASIADFGDLVHLRGVFAGVSLPNELVQEIGDTSIHDMLEQGVSLVENVADNKVEEKLNDILKGENAIVVMAASAAVFAETVEFDPTEEPHTGPVVEPVAPPVANPVAAPAETTQDSLLHAPLAQASPASSTDALEKKLAGLQRKRKCLIDRVEFRHKYGRDNDSFFVEIVQVDAEIDEVYDQIQKLVALQRKKERFIARVELYQNFGWNIDSVFEEIERVDAEIDEVDDQIHSA